jgi:hypothetical protein
VSSIELSATPISTSGESASERARLNEIPLPLANVKRTIIEGADRFLQNSQAMSPHRFHIIFVHILGIVVTDLHPNETARGRSLPLHIHEALSRTGSLQSALRRNEIRNTSNI